MDLNTIQRQEVDHEGPNTGILLFLFISIGIGAFVRHLLKNTPLPYTVILMVVGLLIGLASNSSSVLDNYTKIANINPHLMLLIFLPTLIFESAFIMDVHTFKKTVFQALVLACPGLIITTALTAIMARYIFSYDWSWVTAVLFGAIFSATDPVAVVALLKDLGTSKQLGTVIEGESLLNDGIAIVVFNICLDELIPGHSRTGLQVVIYLIRVAFGGPAFGYVMARLTIWWLSHVYNDAVVEITITLASTYFTYYVADVLLGVSGVLAVLTLGIEINSRRTNISPEVEAFLLKFWGMLSYLANTLIFILVGVVISQRAFSGVEDIDWIFLATLYFGITVIRLIMVLGLSPMLACSGYPINWKGMLMITWSGLRGAVSLALALVVEQTSEIPTDRVGDKILFHAAGIVILTLLVNATTISHLLDALGMSDISHARRLTMMTAVRRITEAKAKAMRLLKSDRFLADAHWDVVDKKTVIENPFDSDEEDDESQIDGLDVTTHCPDCHGKVPRVPNAKEIAELVEELRIRIIRAEKTSYWKQFEEGMLDRVAVLALNSIADTVTDTPYKLIEKKDIAPYWRIPGYLILIRRWIEKVISIKTSSPPMPNSAFRALTLRLVTNVYFDWVIFFVVLLDMNLIIAQLAIRDTNYTATLAFRYTNCVIIGIYTTEAFLKLIGMWLYYFKSPFDIFDFFLLVVGWVDVALEILSISDIPLAIRVFSFLRIVRVVRILKLFKLTLPLAIKLITFKINIYVRLGYGIGKGFVVGEEDVLQQFERISSVVHKNIAYKMRKKVDVSRLEVIRCLGLMQQQYPGVALSVKTQQAIRSVLNHCRSTFESLREGGVLEEHDAHILSQTIEEKMKRLQMSSVTLTPPDPNSILCNHPWLSGVKPHVLRSLQKKANLISRRAGEVLVQYGERAEGLFIIVSGLVKVVTYKQLDHSYSTSSSNIFAIPGVENKNRTTSLGVSTLAPKAPQSSNGSPSHASSELPIDKSGRSSTSSIIDKSTMLLNMVECIDFYDVGNILGEIGILEHKENQIDAICETDVQVFFIEKKTVDDLLSRYPVLRDRMWKIVGVHIASSLLAKLTEYQDWPVYRLLLMLYEAAHILPESLGPSCVEIQSDWKQVIVISGEVEDSATEEKLIGPCIVPSKIRLLTLKGKPKVLVVSLSKSGTARDYDNRTPRHYKKSVKIYFNKIKKLLWAQTVTIKDALMKYMVESFDYLVNQCAKRWQRLHKVSVLDDCSRSSSNATYLSKRDESINEIDSKVRGSVLQIPGRSTEHQTRVEVNIDSEEKRDSLTSTSEMKRNVVILPKLKDGRRQNLSF